MAYNDFAYFDDELNSEADYDALYRYITGELQAHGILSGILADLGCGTGDLTLMLAQAGYDVIGIDRSEEMLSVLREKADELDMTGRILLLRQDLRQRPQLLREQRKRRTSPRGPSRARSARERSWTQSRKSFLHGSW